MAEEDKSALAKYTYNNLTETLKQNNIPYQESPDDLVISCRARGEDLPMDFLMSVEADYQMVMLTSRLPFDVPEDKKVDMAVAVNIVNCRLAAGCFIYNFQSDKIYFRIESSYRDSPMSNEIFLYMVNVSMSTVDNYNDKFYMLATNMISLEKFTENVMGGN